MLIFLQMVGSIKYDKGLLVFTHKDKSRKDGR